jgi:uncharacterized membrane protein
MPRLLAYFIRGLVVVSPIAITAYVLWLMFHTIDGWLGITTPGVGLLITLSFTTFIGFLASTVITRSVVRFLEDLLSKVPFVRLLYSSSRELLNAFVGEKKRFDRPVLVAIGGGVKVMGFVTQDTLTNLPAGAAHVAVYLPQSYHWAGQLVIVPFDQLTVINAAASDVLAFVVSGGVTTIPAPGTAATAAG